MEYLIVDTSGTKNFIALLSEKEEKILSLPHKELTSVIHTALISLKIDALDFIAICNGPGFFTGIRIGVSIAKALSYSRKIPLIPFHSLELLKSAPHQAKVLDARGGKVYAAYGEERPQLYKIEELPKKLPLQIKELLTSDASELKIDSYPLLETSPDLRLQEKNWALKLSCGQTDSYTSLQIDYLH